jgi:chromosome segregation ATPase
MFRKLFLIGIGAAGALALTNFVWSGSISTAWKKARTVVERQIAPEFEIERIRDQISRLTPDMNRHIEKIAEATVECASLNRKIELVSGELEKREKDILAMTEKVERGIVPVGYTPTNLKDKLARDLKAYKSCERDLSNKRKLLDAKQKALESARQQLRAIQESRQTLEVELARMEAELAEVRVAQSVNKVQLDDSRLGKIKGSLEKLRETIECERTKIELTGQFLNDPVAETKTEPAKDVVNEVREYFQGKKSEPVNTAANSD